MKLGTFLTGWRRAELVSADPAEALGRYAAAGIRYFDPMLTAPLTMELTLSRLQWKRLETLAQSRGDRCRCLREGGLPLWFRAARKRKTFLAGAMAVLLFFLLAPSRVWFVRVEGASAVPEEEILRAAVECGVRFGARAKDIRSERVKNRMLSLVHELEWTGVNFSGGVATICVRERAPAGPVEDHSRPTNVVASRPGVIVSMSVLGGQAACKEGQSVLEGQLLISGLIDCNTHTQVTHADGEVYALTRHVRRAIYPAQWQEKTYSGREKRTVSLVLGRKRIKLFGNSGISTAGCDKMVSVWNLTLPGGYALPLRVETVTLRPYDAGACAADGRQAETVLRQFCRRCTEDDMIAGEILKSTGAMKALPGAFCLEAEFDCREMIARQKNLYWSESEEN